MNANKTKTENRDETQIFNFGSGRFPIQLSTFNSKEEDWVVFVPQKYIDTYHRIYNTIQEAHDGFAKVRQTVIEN